MFRIILIGDSEVGKTSLFQRYTDDIFTQNPQPENGSHISLKRNQF